MTFRKLRNRLLIQSSELVLVSISTDITLNHWYLWKNVIMVHASIISIVFSAWIVACTAQGHSGLRG